MKTRRPPEDRFWEKVRKGNPDECWMWTASLIGRGYGTFRLGGTERHILAHRFSYALVNGAIPDGLFVLHKCDTPACVNPKHLFVGTAAANAADRDAKGRAKKPPLHRGETHPRAKLTQAQVDDIRRSTARGPALARKYGVGTSQITAIRNRSSWQ